MSPNVTGTQFVLYTQSVSEQSSHEISTWIAMLEPMITSQVSTSYTCAYDA